MERTDLAPGYAISRIIKGGWQLAGGHGAVSRDAALADMAAYVQAGITTFDCADIYTGVEELIGAFRAHADPHLRVHTKFVPDLSALATVDRATVRRLVARSLGRLRQERLDLVQFHWWDLAIPRHVEVAQWLAECQRDGMVELLGGTNFDAAATEALHAAGITLATMQVQYSLLDTRPEQLAGLCARTGMRLLCYGTVAGGFFSERWLGVAEPLGPLANRSLVKYKLIIDDAGGWDFFQALLRTLAGIAARHGTDIATVASRHVLDQPHVAAVIVGARDAGHLARHAAITALALDPADRAALDAVLAQRRPLDGGIYALERDRAGRHGRIMKYDLSKDAA